MTDIIDDVRETERRIIETGNSITDLVARLEAQKADLEKQMRRVVERNRHQQFNPEKLKEFWQQPYAIVPKRPDEWYVIAPTFVDFQIGWLEKTVRGWNYFVVNKFVTWLAQVPKELQEKFRFREPLPLKVFDEHVFTGSKHQDEAWKRYRTHFRQRVGTDKIAITRGHEFQLMAEMINDGILPFMPRPVQEVDLREPEGDMTRIALRDYQQEAWERFLEMGAVGVYWPFGAGKTYIGLWALAHVKGRKFVAVPTTTLKEQWQARILKFIPYYAGEVDVVTYHQYRSIREGNYVLGIFDECHRLPANTFSRLATLRMKYRLGLSATPYREDGRTDFIFALTGFPVGMDWREILAQGYVNKPTVTLYILPSYHAKMNKIRELVRDEKKTLIYSYWLDFGEQISSELGVPFVYGGTKNRLDILKDANIAVVSSVGGEGVSLPDLERVIEASFHFGGRTEEGQLMGRLFHSEADEPEHIILMTDEELERYEKRLYAIYEKGFRINIIR